MNGYTATANVLLDSLRNLWDGVAAFVPLLIAAIVVFLLAWLVGILLGKLVWHLVKISQLDRGLESIGLKKIWERSGHKLDSGLFFYELVKWFFVVVGLMTAMKIIGLTDVADLLKMVLAYLPHVFIAAVVLVAGVLAARLVESLIRSSVRMGNLTSAHLIGAIARWGVLVFAALIALDQLGAGDMIKIAETGVIVALALAFGLAFGLGGKGHADEVLTKWRKKMEE